MRGHVKTAIAVAVVMAAVGVFFSVHAMTGGSDSPKANVEASQTPAPGDAQAPAVSAVCAAGHPDCVDVTVVPDSELTCEEAAGCAQSTIGGALPIKCDPKLACSNASNNATHCPPNIGIEACYPAAQPAGPYVCAGTPTDVTPIVCTPAGCTFANDANGVPQMTAPPICEPYPCGATPPDAAPTKCDAPPPGTAPLPPDCAISSDGHVACPDEPTPPDGGSRIAPSGSGVAEGVTVGAGSATP